MRKASSELVDDLPMTKVRTAFCHEPFADWPIIDTFQYLAELGYDGVELQPYLLPEMLNTSSLAGRNAVRRAAESAGIEIIGIHSILKEPGSSYHLTHPNPTVRAETIEHLKMLIRLCGDLGGWIIPVGGAKQRNLLPGVTHEQAWGYLTDAFHQILDLAEERQVVLCMEPLSHRLTDFVTTAAEAVRLVEQIEHPHLKMMLDVRSASDDELPIPDLVRESAPYLAHFHANDDNARGPGMGSSDYAGIAAALRKIGYDGYLSVEAFDFRPDAQTLARQSLTTLKQHFG